MEIKLTYYSDFIDENVIDTLEKNLKKNSIELNKYDLSGIPQMNALDLISQFSLYLTPVVTAGLAGNLLSSAAYDILKATVSQLWTSLKGKTFHQVFANGRVEEKEVSLGIKFESNNSRFELKIPLSLSDEMKGKCIDNIFEFIKKQSHNESNYIDPMLTENFIVTYNEEKKDWEAIEVLELIRRIKK